MRTGRRLLPAAILALALSITVLAPAAGDSGTVNAAKKCKKGRLKVDGKCAKAFKGKPAQIRIAISGSDATFRWSPLKCSGASNLPSSVTKHATVKNKTIRIDSPIGKGYRVRFNGQLVTPKIIDGQASIFGSGGKGVVCFKAVAVKKK